MEVYVRVDLAVKSRNNYELCYEIVKMKTFYYCKNKVSVILNDGIEKVFFSKSIDRGVIQENLMKGVKRPYVEKDIVKVR